MITILLLQFDLLRFYIPIDTQQVLSEMIYYYESINKYYYSTTILLL